MNNWTPDYKEDVEETVEDIGPMKDLGDGVDDGTHTVEDDKDISWDTITDEEFEKLIDEEEQEMDKKVETVVKESKESKPTIKKSNHRTMKVSKIDFSRSTGGSRLSRLIGRDNDIML